MQSASFLGWLLLILGTLGCTSPAGPSLPDGAASPVDQVGVHLDEDPILYLGENQSGLFSTIHPEPIGKGGKGFQLSSDKQRIAVEDQGVLMVSEAGGLVATQVASGVLRYQWRPGAHDLLYLAAHPQDKGKWEWHILEETGHNRVITSGQPLTMAWATVSPSGNWLAYQQPGEPPTLVAVSLDDGSVHEIARHPDGFPPPSWAGPDTISLIEDRHHVITVDIGTGQRTELFESGTALTGRQVWSPDGSRLAVTDADHIYLLDRGQPIGQLDGDWEPLGWSSDSKYLAAAKHGTTAADRVVYVIAQVGSVWEATPIPQAAQRFQGWHPNKAALLLLTESEAASDLQVWVVDSSVPRLTRTIQDVKQAAWLE